MITGLELINSVNRRLGWPVLRTLEAAIPTDEQIKVQDTLNRVLETLGTYDDWPMLQKDGQIATLALEVSEDTDADDVVDQFVTATQDSDTITVANMTFNDTYIGRAFKVDGDPYLYRIVEYISPTSVRLHRAWQSESLVPADEATFQIAMDRYALPDDMDRPIDDWQAFFAPYGIRAVSPDDFRERRRREPGLMLGEPEIYTIFGMNDGETVMIVHFHPFPRYKRMFEFPYMRVHPQVNSDNDKILWPRKYRGAIEDMVYQLCTRDFEDDSKAQQLLIEMIGAYNVQAANPTVTGTTLRLRPEKRMRTTFHNAYGWGGYRINWGAMFDRVDFYNLPE